MYIHFITSNSKYLNIIRYKLFLKKIKGRNILICGHQYCKKHVQLISTQLYITSD